MTTYRLGVNNCFAVKRWPEPEAWAAILTDRLGVGAVQHSLDLTDLGVGAAERKRQAALIREACARRGLELRSTFTGLAAYSSNLLLHPDAAVRDHAEEFFRRAIDFTAEAGGTAAGGHVGALSETDGRDPGRQAALSAELEQRLSNLSGHARERGLVAFYIENLPAVREPSTIDAVSRLLTDGNGGHVPVRVCLDVGHMCRPGASGEELDPYAWLRRLGARSGCVHLQQSDAEGDHHWPFTAAANAKGRIRAEAVLDALDQSSAAEVDLILEVIHPFEAEDETVLADLEASVAHWREALARHG